MENLTPTPSVMDIATPAQSDALWLFQTQRLKDMAEALMQAAEAMPMPEDHIGLDKAAKAMISLTRMLKTIHQASLAMTAKPEKPDPASAKTQAPQDETAQAKAHKAALQSWGPSLNLKLGRLADKRRATMAAIPDFALAPP